MTEQERKKRADENYTRMKKQLDERLNADKTLEKISEKIKSGKADLSDTVKYSEIVSNHIGEVIAENVGEINIPLGKKFVCMSLLEDHYERINDVLGKVQIDIDERMGIHIAPQKAPYPAERVERIGGSLEDTSVDRSVIERRARNGAANVANSFHTDYVMENAKFRSDAGLKCYIERDAHGKCCEWCAQMAGRYAYGEEPKDIYRRHDNCTCTVTYECGRGKQDAWTKKTWEQPPEDPPKFEPTVLNPEQARQLQEKNLRFKGLTKGGESERMIDINRFGNIRGGIFIPKKEW